MLSSITKFKEKDGDGGDTDWLDIPDVIIKTVSNGWIINFVVIDNEDGEEVDVEEVYTNPDKLINRVKTLLAGG